MGGTLRKQLALIVAWGRDADGRRVIGRGGGLPWHEPEDLAHFKRVTLGHALVMGRRTHASIGRALPGRRNLVVSRDRHYAASGCEVFPSIEAALAAARTTDPCPFVIGGAAIYAATLPLATDLYVTEVSGVMEGDTWFPDFDEMRWSERTREVAPAGRLVFLHLQR